jgi:hypothetical protein
MALIAARIEHHRPKAYNIRQASRHICLTASALIRSADVYLLWLQWARKLKQWAEKNEEDKNS